MTKWTSRSVTQVYSQLLRHSDLGFRFYTTSGTREVSHWRERFPSKEVDWIFVQFRMEIFRNTKCRCQQRVMVFGFSITNLLPLSRNWCWPCCSEELAFEHELDRSAASRRPPHQYLPLVFDTNRPFPLGRLLRYCTRSGLLFHAEYRLKKFLPKYKRKFLVKILIFKSKHSPFRSSSSSKGFVSSRIWCCCVRVRPTISPTTKTRSYWLFPQDYPLLTNKG